MIFSSITFIFYFLPILCLIYFLVGEKMRNTVLLIASIIFYAWGEPLYVCIMLTTIAISYMGALAVARSTCHKTLWLTLAIFADLSFLIYFKYFNFLTENVNAIFSGSFETIKIVMPIGISFYTFQAISYLVDVYRGEVGVQKNPYKLALYITLFPQLIAGPIVKYHDVAEQIEGRTHSMGQISYGVKRFIIGLGKKVLLANTMGAVADKVFEQSVTNFDTCTAWLGAVAYSMQLFFDFSGYSDMAIGLGAIFGFTFLENFNYPYISRSITEFWRRWHISLSTWFKLYLYIPLGGNRVAKWRMYLNLFIVFLATGVWHGASWAFIVWGIWHGLFILLEKATGWHKAGERWWVRVLQHVYTILIFIIGWVFFRADDLEYGWHYVCRMFGGGGEPNETYHFIYYMDNMQIIMGIVALACSVPLFSNILKFNGWKGTGVWCVNIWLCIVFVLSCLSITASSYNPFIYFRF